MSQPAVRLYAPADVAAGSNPPFVSGQPTVRQVLDWYATNTARHNTSSTAEIERRRVWALFSAALGERLVGECRAYELLNFINAQRRLSAWSKRRWNGTLQRPFNYAERLGLILKNPFRGLTFAQGDEGRDWTGQEFQAILRQAGPRFRRLVMGIRLSGMRPGEVKDLEWPNIRFENGAIVIEKHKTRYLTHRARKIPINRPLLKLLAWLRLHNPQGTRRVFLNSHGTPWTTKALTKALAKIRQAAGLLPDVKLHGGRHTFATNAIMAGVELAALMEILGHSQLATTQRYTHVADKVDHLQESMEQAIRPRPKTKPARAAEKTPAATPLFDPLE